MLTALKSILLYAIIFLSLLFPRYAQGGDGGEAIRARFSPNGGCEKAIIQEIEKADNYIHIAIFSFTNGRMARTLVKAHKKGIHVKIIMDSKMAPDRYSKSRFLKNKGIDVRFRRGLRKSHREHKNGSMHNKFAVIDGKVVITGSYNWSISAEKWNYENLLIVSSSKLAELFDKEFRNLWMEK